MEKGQSSRPLEELPVGLMMGMAQNTRAMDGFFSLDETGRQSLLDSIAGAATGEQAKSRIEHAVEALAEGGEYGAYTHHAR